MPMLEQKSGPDMGSSPPDAAFEKQQRRRMLIALAVLLLALISVLIKDRQFWFPSSPGSESESAEQSVPLHSPQAASAKVDTPIVPPKPVGPAPTQTRSKPASSSKTAATSPASDAAISPIITATNRAVLPPLEVEVVAGNQHRTLSPGDSSVNVDMQPGTSSAAETNAAAGNQSNAPGASNATAQVQLSPGTAQVLSRPVDPSYPLLAKQMKVQGAVVMEALISKTGSIQEIQVLSGPAILSAAAREAVKQWHFKPYYQGGRPVETEARITVNFTISTY